MGNILSILFLLSSLFLWLFLAPLLYFLPKPEEIYPAQISSSDCSFPRPLDALFIYKLTMGLVSEDVRTHFCDALSITRDGCVTMRLELSMGIS